MNGCKVSRRDALKAGGAIAMTPFLSVRVVADTDSGNVELTTDATIVPDTDITVRAFEDTQERGASSRRQAVTVENGTQTYVLDELIGYENQDFEFWIWANLTTQNLSETPELHQVVIELPATQPNIGDIQVWEDTFADGEADGWYNEGDNITAGTSTDSIEGDYSMFVESADLSEQDRPTFEWIDGPNLDLREDFVIYGVLKFEHIGPDPSNGTVRIGITGDDQTVEGENAYLIFSAADGTWLGTHYAGQTEGDDAAIPTVFEGDWVRFMIESEADSDGLRAKVWEYGATEPGEYHMQLSGFEGVNGLFGINPGFSSHERQVWLGEIEVRGQQFIPEDNPNLVLNARNFIELDNTIPYSISYNDLESGWVDVTDTVGSIQSYDTDVVTIDETNNVLEGVGKGETTIEIEHQGLIAGHGISVAEIAVSDLDLLPLSRKVQAMVQDSTVQGIFITGLIGAVVARIARNPWVGVFTLAGLFLLLWAWGVLGTGMGLIAIFFAMLAGMVLLNVDRTPSINIRN